MQIDNHRRPIVDFPGNPGERVAARCLEGIFLEGRPLLENVPVLLVFEHGDPELPIIVGVVDSEVSPPKMKQSGGHAIVDGRRIVLKGDEEVTLVCGKSSITLAKNGHIHLRGVEIVSRASGANKIRGASVNIN